MLQFFPIILLRIAQKFPRLFSILFSTFFDIIHCIGTGGIIIIRWSGVRVKIITTLSLPSFDYYKICVQFLMYYKNFVQFLTYYKIFKQNGGNSIFSPIILALFSILTHTDYSQNYSGIIRASLYVLLHKLIRALMLKAKM